jgi:hypothetical protein
MDPGPLTYLQALSPKHDWIRYCRAGGGAMIYFFRRASDTRSCELRLQADGAGFELVVTDAAGAYVEQFDDVAAVIAREYELRQRWQMHGWRTLDPFDDEGDDEG